MSIPVKIVLLRMMWISGIYNVLAFPKPHEFRAAIVCEPEDRELDIKPALEAEEQPEQVDI